MVATMTPSPAELLAEAANPATPPERLTELVQRAKYAEVAIAALGNPNIPLDGALTSLEMLAAEERFSATLVTLMAESLLHNEALPFLYLTERPLAVRIREEASLVPLKVWFPIFVDDEVGRRISDGQVFADVGERLARTTRLGAETATQLGSDIQGTFQMMASVDLIGGNNTRFLDLYDALSVLVSSPEAKLSTSEQAEVRTVVLRKLAEIMGTNLPPGLPITFDPFATE